VITSIDGAKVTDSNSLRNHVAALKPGTKARIVVVRDGREQTLTATLGELPSSAPAATPTEDAADRGGAGLSVQPLTPETARRFGIEAQEGLVVTNVDPDGPAAGAGFRPGDVIQEVDGKQVEDAASLRRELARAGDRPALVLVQRGDTTVFLTLTPRTS
jgi:serine protease Do